MRDHPERKALHRRRCWHEVEEVQEGAVYKAPDITEHFTPCMTFEIIPGMSDRHSLDRLSEALEA
jgi:hypothetical protein